MPSRPGYLLDLEAVLAVPAVLAVIVAVVVAPLSLVLPVLSDEALSRPMAVATGALALLIFLRLLFSRSWRHAMTATNQAFSPRGPFLASPPGFNDPEWGWKGRKMGPGWLAGLRIVVLPEFMIVTFISVGSHPWLVVQMFAAAMLVILLSQSQLQGHFPLPDRAGD